VPEDFDGTKSTAEIAVHPSGQFVYGLNRGFPDSTSPVADSIVGYTVDQTSGELTLIGHTTDGIDFPRNFSIRRAPGCTSATSRATRSFGSSSTRRPAT
jgi:6-phosphogluconolactonase